MPVASRAPATFRVELTAFVQIDVVPFAPVIAPAAVTVLLLVTVVAALIAKVPATLTGVLIARAPVTVAAPPKAIGLLPPHCPAVLKV